MDGSGDGIHRLYFEINSLFDTIATVARVGLVVALIVLAGAATAWFRANTPARRDAYGEPAGR